MRVGERESTFVCLCASVWVCAHMFMNLPRPCVCMWLSQSCSVSQASDMWICGLTAEEFITDNYVRMCWKRNKPRTVWAGRCWASAYTVPRAPCTPASHTLPPPPGLSKLEMAAEKTLESPNQLIFYFSPYSPLTSLWSTALNTFDAAVYCAESLISWYTVT